MKHENILRTRSFLPCVILALGVTGFSSTATAQGVEAPPPAANPTDVESVDAIVAAVYDVISGPAGQARDWDRWRSLFLPEARLIATGRTPDGGFRYQVMTPEEYVQGIRTIPGGIGIFRR